MFSLFACLPVPMLLVAHGIATSCLHVYLFCILPHRFVRKRDTVCIPNGLVVLQRSEEKVDIFVWGGVIPVAIMFVFFGGVFPREESRIKKQVCLAYLLEVKKQFWYLLWWSTYQESSVIKWRFFYNIMGGMIARCW